MMAMSILPSIMSVGLIGLLLVKYTPVFEWLGILFYPFACVAQLPDPMLVSKAAATGLAEMFLPALITSKADFVSRFVIGQILICSILFFSASIPCILPISVKQILVVWFQRTVITLLLSARLPLCTLL